MDKIKIKLDYLDEIITKIENKEGVNPLEIIKKEIEILKLETEIYIQNKNDKKVIKKEIKGNKIRYYLKDGSVYLIKGFDNNFEYKYLYDAKTKTIRYEFKNGQIESTFENGLKEIRTINGEIFIKHNPMEYDQY